MTQGSVVHLLFSFAFPLFLGNLFQTLYNTVDAWVVGNFVSNEAFAAVGTVAPITHLLIYCFSGLSTGAGVVISQYYGAHQEENVHRSVHTFVVLTLILSVLFSVIGVVFSPAFLRMMNTAPSVMPEATAYLRIYFGGLSGLLLYNMGAGILRAVGDSRRPFRYLVVCALTNIVLDLFFVLRLGLGVKGVAYATVIAQFVSAFLILFTLLKTDSCVQILPARLRIYPAFLRKILHQGLPAALQMSITSFSSIYVQSYIYQFGADCMSGWAAYSKVNQLLNLSVHSMGTATSTFVGQNLGNRDLARAKKGLLTASLMIVSLTVVLAVPLFAFAPPLIAFFNDKAEVVEFGAFILRLMVCFYAFFGVSTVCTSAIRGSGNSRTPLIIILSSYVGFRQVYMFVVSNFISNTVLPLVFAMPVSWMLAAAASLVYLKVKGLQQSQIVKASDS